MEKIFRGHNLLRLTVVLLMLANIVGCSRTESPAPAEQQPFRICMGGILAPLPFVAKEKGLLQAQGVAAEILLVGDGKAAMSSFLEGKCDACLSGEFPVVRQSFDRDDLVIIATLSSSDNAVKVLARRDRGIKAPADIVGKRVAVSKGTISNFFLDQFLNKNRIPRDKLTLVDMSHQEVADALKRGDIDAFAGSDVAYLKGRKLIGDQGITFSEPGLTNHAACLTVKKKWLAANPAMAKKVLVALLNAEKELARQPEDYASLLSEQLKIQKADLQSIMAEQHNRLNIDQVLILALEDEARWMLENGTVKGKRMPNYLHFLDTTILKSINPAAVNLR